MALDLPLFATPATRRALAEARAVAILIGSYDGSGNYGDIAQLDAGLRMLEPSAPGLLVLPVLERIHLQGHRNLLETFQTPPEHAIYFDPESAGDDDLLPLAVPSTLVAGAVYLYGGGYLNPNWGARKLAMVRTAEDLLAAAEVTEPVRLSSGLQVDLDWLKALPAEEAALLRSFELLGARDPLSAEALAVLDAPGTVIETGDDALGDIPVLVSNWAAPKDADKLYVNLHFGGHQWVSGRPDELRDYTLDFIRELGERSGRAVCIRPQIAYLDSRIDERPGTEALAAEAHRQGIEVEEPRVLRPSALPTLLPELEDATATISCSYHIALTSLLLGIPTVFFADNPYYVQKAAGLLAAFGLPSSFAISAGSDPAPVVAEILDEGPRLRETIARNAEALRRVRAAAEVELLGRLSRGVMAQLADETDQLTERLRERSAEPAGLRIELASLQTQTEELSRPAIAAAVLAADRATERAEEQAAQAEERARQAEERTGRAEAENAAAHARLAEVFGSRSWKLAAPVRAIGRALRRLRRGRGA